MSTIKNKTDKTAGAGEVRIIGGKWKRTKLPVANVQGLRPTPNRVRETLFNWLGQDLSGWRCFDVFAGTGALGFEAASRGAAEVIMVEWNRKVTEHLRALQLKLQADNIDIKCADGMAILKQLKGSDLDLIFLDPPFDSDLFEQAVLAAQEVIAPTGVIYLEANRAINTPSGLSCYRQAQAGAVYYYLFTPLDQGEE